MAVEGGMYINICHIKTNIPLKARGLLRQVLVVDCSTTLTMNYIIECRTMAGWLAVERRLPLYLHTPHELTNWPNDILLLLLAAAAYSDH